MLIRDLMIVALLGCGLAATSALANGSDGDTGNPGSHHLYKVQAGEMLCTARATIHRMAKRDFGEEPMFFGVTKNGYPLEVLANFETGTWTLLVVPEGLTEGDACVPAFGQDFQLLKTE